VKEESLSGQRLFKDHRWRIAEINWVLGVRKPIKQKPNNPYIPTCCLGGFQEKIFLAYPWTNSSIFSGQTRLGLLAPDSIVRLNLKKGFLAANPQDVFGANRDNKYSMPSMPTVRYTTGSLMLWAYFLAGGPGHLVQIHGIVYCSKHQQIKKSKPDCLCYIL